MKRDSWKENFKKIEVNSSLEVVPSWEKSEKDKSIVIEPKPWVWYGNS